MRHCLEPGQKRQEKEDVKKEFGGRGALIMPGRVGKDPCEIKTRRIFLKGSLSCH